MSREAAVEWVRADPQGTAEVMRSMMAAITAFPDLELTGTTDLTLTTVQELAQTGAANIISRGRCFMCTGAGSGTESFG